MKMKLLIISLFAGFLFIQGLVYASEDTPNRLTVTMLVDRITPFVPSMEFCSLTPEVKHYAYIHHIHGKSAVVYDGKQSRLYDEILEGTPVFSPDCQSFAYVASEGKQWFVVLNGREGKRYDTILENMITFSRDSEHLAYIAKSGDAHMVVVDEKESSKHYGNIRLKVDKNFFTASGRFHYFIIQGQYVYYVEEKII